MLTRRSVITALSCLLLVAALAGCSNVDEIIMPNSDSSQAASNGAYFPTTTGRSSTLLVTNDGGGQSYLTLQVGSPASIGTTAATQWFAIRPDNSVDTDYVVVTTSGVTLFETPRSAAETILKFPLAQGASWVRFAGSSDSSANGSDSTTIATGNGGGIITKGGDTGGGGGGGGGAGKVLPNCGGTISRVSSIEDVVTTSGRHFSSSVKIEVDDQQGFQNFYWFAPGVGLVKYILRATPQRPNGVQRGEVISY
ncbi:MAG: hypothetical protein WAU88_03350 [Candidatus Zixiibacteriota bacterium]